MKNATCIFKADTNPGKTSFILTSQLVQINRKVLTKDSMTFQNVLRQKKYFTSSN